jgi:hypothetical protein
MNWSDLPESFITKAVFLSGEPAWPPETAREVVSYLSSKGQAVLGVEAWIPEQGSPRVVGWSEYNITIQDDWKESVRQNAIQAVKTIEESGLEGALYSLEWVGDGEIAQ